MCARSTVPRRPTASSSASRVAQVRAPLPARGRKRPGACRRARRPPRALQRSAPARTPRLSNAARDLSRPAGIRPIRGGKCPRNLTREISSATRSKPVRGCNRPSARMKRNFAKNYFPQCFAKEDPNSEGQCSSFDDSRKPLWERNPASSPKCDMGRQHRETLSRPSRQERHLVLKSSRVLTSHTLITSVRGTRGN
jgi:hypothetical protein